MTRLLLNGSPRGRASNSRLLLSWLVEGLGQAGAAEPPMLDLARTQHLDEQRRAFLEADEVVLAFPLYTDSMPGIVKSFFESLADAEPARLRGKRVGFIVQSGFPESIHSEAVAAWLARVSTRLGFVHVGTLVRGGVEGIRVQPEGWRKKLRALFVRAGRELGAQGAFSKELAAELAQPRTLSRVRRAMMTLLAPLGLPNLYWNMKLKEHGAYARRFDAPYGAPAKRP